ncbi:uncharacterized protein LOC113226687 [Hyposmocoma kahamanoa]|uniref:uncharacterized protein LOC113226687 n=1 Tax=Hyposmocoma kahamanoa TaxID=1477025 RepID=UPI000E6D981F|nr:uncharacterized protein LOC113226687 [Hyposmocoma kahamanoa]
MNMNISWWTYVLIAVVVFLLLLIAHYLVKKFNENKFEERYMQLYRKNSASTQVQSPLIDMEVKKSDSKMKKDDESYKGISLVFSKTIQRSPRLSSSATTCAAEEKKMKCIFNKGITFCSNDTIKHNLSAEIKIRDHDSPYNTILQKTDGTSSVQNLDQTPLVTESANKSKTQFAADIYSLVKSSSNMLILEEMKANENIYNLHLGTIYTQSIDDNFGDKSIVLNNVIESPKSNIDKPEIVLSKEKRDAVYDANRYKDHTKILLGCDEEIIEMQDIKNKINITDLGPGVLTMALLESADSVSNSEPALRAFNDEANVSTEIKDSDSSPTSVNSTDEISFSNSIISKNSNTVVKMEYLTSKITSRYENFTKVPISRQFYNRVPKTLSVIQETGYSDVNFSDCILQSLSNTKLDSKKSDGVRLISSDSAFNKTLYKIKFEPEASTSTYKRIFKSLLCDSEDDAVITLEKNNIAEKDKQSMDKLKIGGPNQQKNEENNFQCETL